MYDDCPTGQYFLECLKFNVILMILILQGCFSILSGLTLAAFLHIDVSNIPPESYRFIVLVGIENMSESA